MVKSEYVITLTTNIKQNLTEIFVLVYFLFSSWLIIFILFYCFGINYKCCYDYNFSNYKYRWQL